MIVHGCLKDTVIEVLLFFVCILLFLPTFSHPGYGTTALCDIDFVNSRYRNILTYLLTYRFSINLSWELSWGCWSGCERVIVEDEAADVVRSLVEARVYRDVVDFDNHLDDISLDWRNADIDEQIAECICWCASVTLGI